MSFIGTTGLNTFDEEIENTSNYVTRISLDSSNYILDTSNVILQLLEVLPYEKLSVPIKDADAIGFIIPPITSEPIIDIDDDYKYIAFTNTGANQTPYTINFPENTECDILVVGGGGARGDGGGGGGQLIYQQSHLSSGEYTINVGKGRTSNGRQRNGNNGENSSIANATNILLLSYGGGGGQGAIGGQFPIYTGNVGSGGGTTYDTLGINNLY